MNEDQEKNQEASPNDQQQSLPTDDASPLEQTDGTQANEPAAESAEAQIAVLKDLLLRKAAEFENYKRRAASDASGIIRLANEGLVLSVLPVVDDLERSLKAGKDIQAESSFYKGVEMIYQKLVRTLESHGVTPLETTGKAFDVRYHDAMMQAPRSDMPHHTILEEVERGYTMNGKVIRHAKVVVSTVPEEDNETVASGENSSPGDEDA